MAGNGFSFKTGILYILLGGIVVFAAVFLGIRAGFAIKSDRVAELTPETLFNRSILSIGDPVPFLPLKTVDGKQITLDEITYGRKTLVAVTMPGCDPCERLLTEWRRRNWPDPGADYDIIMIAATYPDRDDLGPLEEFTDNFPVYFCSLDSLEEYCGISTFPSVLGFDADNSVSFIANGRVYDLNEDFLENYL